MNSKTFLLVALLLSCTNLFAQEVSYYKLVRANSNRDVSGGQFITFIGKQCYESNRHGVSVDNGRLTLNSNYSNSQYTTYQGSSYWGSSTTFKFNADKSVLNVVLDNGDIYVYKRTTPPAGVTTCSLIRPKSNSSSSGYTPPPTYPVQQYPQQYPQQQYQYPQQQNPTPTQQQPQPQQKKICKWCNGSRRISKEDGFSLGMEKKYCSECGQTVFQGHYHIDCPYCHGTGYE